MNFIKSFLIMIIAFLSGPSCRTTNTQETSSQVAGLPSEDSFVAKAWQGFCSGQRATVADLVQKPTWSCFARHATQGQWNVYNSSTSFQRFDNFVKSTSGNEVELIDTESMSAKFDWTSADNKAVIPAWLMYRVNNGKIFVAGVAAKDRYRVYFGNHRATDYCIDNANIDQSYVIFSMTICE